jgi:hypothetical protein
MGSGRTPRPTPERNAAAPRDRVSLSNAGRDAARQTAGLSGQEALSAEEQQKVAALKRRDAEVKAHEQAHLAAGGGLVQGGASYQYATGPDGKQYVVGGEVKIDTSPERTPEATIRKMQQVRRAALAPADPSGADRAVAAAAAQTEAQARAALGAGGVGTAAGPDGDGKKALEPQAAKDTPAPPRPAVPVAAAYGDRRAEAQQIDLMA